jgi:predicted nucleotidyltransferase
MKRDEAIARLKPHEPEFRRSGIQALYLFGSTARDGAGDTSDVDLMCDLQRENLSLLDFYRLEDRLAEILAAPVDLVERRSMRPRIRDRVEPEAIRVF